MLEPAWDAPDLRPYRHQVLVGPWLAAKHQERARLDKFREDYEQGVTALQNTRRMKANLLQPQTLAMPDAVLRIGDIVQVVAPDMPAFSLAAPRGHLGVFLSGTIDEVSVDRCQFLIEGSAVKGSADTEPCARNSWRICAEDGSRHRDGQPLRFGQAFTLRAVDAAVGTRCPLFVRAKCATTNDVGCGPPKLELSTECDTYCRWRAVHVDKNKRAETDGVPFPPNMRVVLQHAASSLNLAVSAGGKRHWPRTFFGRECPIGLKDYKDQYKQVTSENVWMLCSQRLRDRRAELPCPAPELYPPPPRPATPPTPPDPCTPERVCPLPLPAPDQRKFECTADMPCQRDVKCAEPHAPYATPAHRAGERPCPRDHPGPICPKRNKCLRWDALQDNSMWCSWHKMV